MMQNAWVHSHSTLLFAKKLTNKYIKKLRILGTIVDP